MKIIEATREYIVTDTSMSKCDICKKVYARLFDLTPVTKTGVFDSLLLCPGCLNKCHLTFNIDVRELIMAESVEEWQKKN